MPKAIWLANVAQRWGADHIHCHWAGTTASMAMLASRVSGIPWSFTAHRWDIVENNLLAAKVRSARFARFISQDGLRMAREIGIPTTDNARVLHMGVSIPSPVQRGQRSKPVVLCPARLVAVRSLLPARGMADFGEPGFERGAVARRAGRAQNPIGKVQRSFGSCRSIRFLGAVPHGELLKLYEQTAISAVVLPSLDLGQGVHEGIPVAPSQAMSFGIPVVATATGGTTEPSSRYGVAGPASRPGSSGRRDRTARPRRQVARAARGIRAHARRGGLRRC